MGEPSPVAILIEDERQIRRFVRTALEGEGWVVHEADTMRQGLTDAGTRKPDLIILDLGLPDGDGVAKPRARAPRVPLRRTVWSSSRRRLRPAPRFFRVR